MARFKFLLALFLFANFADFSSADEDDDTANADAEVTSAPFSASDWANKECTVVNAKAPKYYLYLSGFFGRRSVSYKRLGRPKKSSKWIINPVQSDGNTYFEMKNMDSKNFIAPYGRNRVASSFKSFTRTSRIETLWKFDPPKQGVPISITSSSKNLFMNEPQGSSGSKVLLSTNKKTAWMINCD